MKLKSVVMAICSVVCAGAVWTAVDNGVSYASAEGSAVDISAGATISGWSDSAELKQLTISFDKTALPTFNYDAMDKDTYKYVQEYLYFNGKSVKEINEDTSLGAVNWTYTQFPGTADDIYKVPVLIFQRDAARLRLFIHENYFAMLGNNPTFELKEGLTFVNEGTTYVMEESRLFTYNGSAWETTQEEMPKVETDITANVTVNGWNVTGDTSELTYTRINLGEGIMPEGVGYGIIDVDEWKYIQEYVTINGRTVADINANTDTSDYVFSTFPSTADAKYKVPVMIYVNNGTLEVKVHNDYIATLGEDPTIIIGVKAGLSVSGTNVIYKVTEDVAATVREQTVVVDITANVTVNGWNVTGDTSELTYTRINLGEGVMPEGVGYGIIDDDAWKYIQEYITINGRTVADINANTDTSDYVFSTFPSTADAKYKVPVMIYVNNGTLEVKVHNDYMVSLGDNIDVIIGVKAGLSVKVGSTAYTVTEDVQNYVRRKKYTLTAEYVAGTEYQYLLTMGSEIVLGTAEQEHYTFVGWFEKDTDNEALTVMPERDYAIYAKYTAIEYTVTFKADAVQVGETQTYTVENKTINEPTAPAKEHYTAVWSAYELNGGDVVVEAIYTAIEYTVSFMDGETVIGTATYTVENTGITEPVVPTKAGYTSAWDSYELTGGDITVEVIYTLIENEDSSFEEDSSIEDSSVEDTSSNEDSSIEDISSNEDSVSNDISNSVSSESSKTSGSGCSGTVGLSVGVVMAGLLTVVLLKKKENE